MLEKAIDLPAEPVSAGLARRFVTAALRSWSLTGVADEALLLTSELISNAVLHSGSTVIHLRVARLADAVRIEVGDDSGAQPRRRHYGSESGTGRGLALVENAARAWGSVPTAGGKTVWCELPTG